MPLTLEHWKDYVANDGSVLFMLDELRKYLVDNDMVRFIPEEHWEYIEKMERRNKEPEQYTVKQILDDAVVDGMRSKTTESIICLDMSIQSASELVCSNEDEKRVKAFFIEVMKTLKNEFQHQPKISYNLDRLGAEVAKLHAYTCGYEKMIEDSRETGCAMQVKRKYVNKVIGILGAIYKNAGFPWNANKHKKNLEELYVGLVKRYGVVINADILCFFYIVYKLDWKGIKSKKKGAESNIIATLFCADDKSDEVLENLQSIYKECFGQLSEENDIYIELYDIVKKVVEGKELGDNATMADIDRCRKFLMGMYVEIIIRIHRLIRDKENKNARYRIKRGAVPLFCNVLCSVRKYERMKMVSLMMQLTKSMMLTEDDGQQGIVRSGCTDYFRVLYKFMVKNSETLDKNIAALGKLSASDARKQCERVIRKEFKGITIPEWTDDEKLSATAKRFNCMMLMACFIACKQYQNPASYSGLLYWLREIQVIYECRMLDLNNTEFIWIYTSICRQVYQKLRSEYCESIAYNFRCNLAKKELNVIGNYIWSF